MSEPLQTIQFYSDEIDPNSGLPQRFYVYTIIRCPAGWNPGYEMDLIVPVIGETTIDKRCFPVQQVFEKGAKSAAIEYLENHHSKLNTRID